MGRWLILVATYLPTVLRVVMGVEDALKGSKGETKKQIALAVINAGAEASLSTPNETVANIARMVDVTVDALNEAGIFTHKEK